MWDWDTAVLETLCNYGLIHCKFIYYIAPLYLNMCYFMFTVYLKKNFFIIPLLPKFHSAVLTSFTVTWTSLRILGLYMYSYALQNSMLASLQYCISCRSILYKADQQLKTFIQSSMHCMIIKETVYTRIYHIMFSIEKFNVIHRT